ncbi:MAG TPA: PAS domain S-box protein [Spirochaetes bacterium]|nr:PAS domain S-box protein [Spirochaetota bacterium]
MNLYAILPLIIGGIAVFIGVSHIIVFYSAGNNRRYLSFGVTSVMAGAYGILCAGLYGSADPVRGPVWQWGQFIVLTPLSIAFLWFVIDYTEYPRKKIARALTILLIFMGAAVLGVRELVLNTGSLTIRTMSLPFLGSAAFYEAGFGPLANLVSFTGFAVSLYAILVCARQAREGNGSDARSLLYAILPIPAGVLNDLAMILDIYQSVYLLEYVFLAVVIFMSIRMTGLIARAAGLRDEVRESENKYRTLIQNIGDAIFSTDKNGVLDFISPSIERILGVPAEEVIGRHFSYFTHPEDVAAVQEAFLRSHPGSLGNIEYRLLTGDGAYRWVGSSSVHLKKDGHFFGIMGVINDIHPRREAEEHLRKSEESLTLALRGADLGMWDWDIATGSVTFNERWAAMLGYTLSDLEPHVSTWEKLLHPDDTGATMAALNVHLEGRAPFYESECRLLCRDGSWKWVLDRGRVIARDADGRPLRAAGTHLDIDERKRVEEELKLSRETYRLVVDNAMDIILVIQDGVIRYTNPRLVDQLGYGAEEVQNKSFLPYIHPDDRARVVDLYRRNLAGETFPTIHDFRVISADGTTRWVSINSTRVLWENRDAILYFLRDITERKEADEEIRRLRNLFKNVIDSMPSIIIGVDADGMVTEWNRGAEIQTGIPPEGARGRLFAEVIPRLGGEIERVRRAIREKEVQLIPKMPRHSGGEIHFEDVTVYPLIANGVVGAVIRIDDVSDRVRLEEMMVQSEKMLSVGGLAAGMAHEINNPLAGIMQNAAVLTRRMTEDLPANLKAADESGISMSALRDYMARRDIPVMLERITDSCGRAARIVQDMLNFSRKTGADRRNHDLAGLLDGTVELASKDYDLKKRFDFRNIKLVREYDPSTPPVECSGGTIQQVFLNILKNAAEAMRNGVPGGGVPRLTLRVRPDGPMVRVEIEDNGPGMDEEVRRRVFEPFYTTKEVGVGTGLGLSVSYFIVSETHGGSLTVESSPGRGAVFIILLPVKSGRYHGK